MHDRDSVKPTHQSQHPYLALVSNMVFLSQSYFRKNFEITSTTKMCGVVWCGVVWWCGVVVT